MDSLCREIEKQLVEQMKNAETSIRDQFIQAIKDGVVYIKCPCGKRFKPYIAFEGTTYTLSRKCNKCASELRKAEK